jgi:hypothetical protein
MAELHDPLDTDPPRLARVTRRTEDDLPDHVKGNDHWRIDHSNGVGYYILNPRNNTYFPLEFLNHHWYRLRVFAGQAYTDRDSRIRHFANRTGYWDITDYQHEGYADYIRQQAIAVVGDVPEQAYCRDPVGLETQEEEAEERHLRFPKVATPLPTLTVDTSGASSLVADPTISPFVAATATAASSPAFIQSREPSDQAGSDRTNTPRTSTPDEPSPEQLGQEVPVLEEQLEYGLVIQEPEEPPLVQPVPPVPQFPAPQPIAPVPAMAAAAQVPTRLVGNTPDIFNGDRTKAEDFKLQFQLHQALNNTNRIMSNPYYRTSYALSLIKGPLVKVLRADFAYRREQLFPICYSL